MAVPWGALTTIRGRLVAALSVALLPVLILGIVQSAINLRQAGDSVKDSLAFAAERSAATAAARMEAADVLLQTLASGSTGFQCAQRLGEVTRRVPGYVNLIRFDAAGRVACAADDVTSDPGRAARPWFQALRGGDQLVVTREPGAAYAGEPVVLAAARAERDGGFDGALAAVIALSSLQPRMSDPTLPAEAEIALVDRAGTPINQSDPRAFSALPRGWSARAQAEGSTVWADRDARGARRIYSAAPLVGSDVFVILSAKAPGVFSWVHLNPLSGVLFPLLAVIVSFVAVWTVTDRVVVRWIAYLQRIAALYARGRLSVRPLQAEQMPAEIRELAETLEDMADAIVGRDATLRDNLAQKDSLMREIHHRVKNNLQVISSLLNMQQRALADPAARAALGDTRQRITALALIYRALYQGPDLKRVDLRPFLEELTAQLMAGDAHGPPVRTELHVDALVIDPDRLAPLALFAVEAITNAQKHAFAGRGGTLRLDFHVRGEQAVLEICDDGLEAGDPAASSGVGRTLMTAFARQLRGTAELVRNEKGGMTARLIFPTPTIDEPANRGEGRNQAAA